ncbi:MAG: type 4a pilus biogenesis protein PilO [Candidatus Omnitrophota bacterium]
MKKIIPDKILNILLQATEKNGQYILIGVLLGIFLLMYAIVTRPILNNLTKISPKITLLSKDYRQALSDIKNVENYQAQVVQFREKMKTVGLKILSKEEIPAILENISRLAGQSKVHISQIMPLKESQELILSNDEGKYYSLPILVNARGGYHDIGRFFNKIENDKIFMSVIDFDIAATSDDPLKHLAKITIKAFILEKIEGKEAK